MDSYKTLIEDILRYWRLNGLTPTGISACSVFMSRAIGLLAKDNDPAIRLTRDMKINELETKLALRDKTIEEFTEQIERLSDAIERTLDKE